MIKICKENKKALIEKIKADNFDNVVGSQSNLVDDIILAMHKNEILNCLIQAMPDKRKQNTTIPFNLVMALSVAAKMKTKNKFK